MKNRIIALSLILAGTCVNINAQEVENFYTKKWTDNIFIGAGIGGMTVFNDGMNTTFNANLSLGKYITPTWGIRAQIGGFQQKIGEQKTGYAGDTKTTFEINFDAMLNITNLLGGNNPDRSVDFYAFVGPTMNIAKAVSTTMTVGEPAIYTEHGSKARIGATAGLGLGYNINDKWAINLEGRFGVTPSVFGNASDYNKAEGTGRLTVGFAYTFGGKRFTKATTNKVVEKVVEKEIVKEVPVEVVKEVIKEVPGSASAAIFFKVGKAVISPEGMVNVKLMAKVIKNNPNAKYKVAGFADKGTGSVQTNQTLSEKRAQAVYDALVAEGVNGNQLQKIGMGGTDPLFEQAHLNRVVILEIQ